MDRMLTILFAEDNEDDVFFLQTALKRAGIKNPTQFVTDGQQAIDYLQGNGKYSDRNLYPFPSYIFTDLKMPMMTGFDVLEWLRASPKCGLLPVMVLTTSSHDGDVKRAYQLGANAYLVKPTTMEQWEKMLRSVQEFWSQCQKPRIEN